MEKFLKIVVLSLFMVFAFNGCNSEKSVEAKNENMHTVVIDNAAFTNGVDVDVSYFWAEPRCSTCELIEKFTKEATSDINNTEVKFKMVDARANMDLVKEYGLYSKSVVLTKYVNGKKEWKNLTEIWTKVRNEADFKTYIVDEVKKFKGLS